MGMPAYGRLACLECMDCLVSMDYRRFCAWECMGCFCANVAVCDGLLRGRVILLRILVGFFQDWDLFEHKARRPLKSIHAEAIPSPHTKEAPIQAEEVKWAKQKKLSGPIRKKPHIQAEAMLSPYHLPIRDKHPPMAYIHPSSSIVGWVSCAYEKGELLGIGTPLIASITETLLLPCGFCGLFDALSMGYGVGPCVLVRACRTRFWNLPIATMASHCFGDWLIWISSHFACALIGPSLRKIAKSSSAVSSAQLLGRP